MIGQALLLTGIVVKAENPAGITNESDESLLAIIRIGGNSL
jgi:hypothetical protein